MMCKPEDYMEYLEEFDMTKEQKEDVIKELWEIARYFVEDAHGVSPTNKMLASLVEKTKKV
jgi:hypothetical protein